MKLQDKISYLVKNHGHEWETAYDSTFNDISRSQSMSCVCGRLATGLHEMNCTKLRKKVISETVKKLAYLIKK